MALQLIDGPGGAFWRRCLGASVRLLRAIICLCPPPDVLKADAMALQLIGTLCTAAGAAPGPSSAAAAVALASTLPRGPLRAPALRRIAGLAELAVSKLQADNPMHLKALEQARAVIAEAKACQKLEEQK
ncbi:hypothetical protein JYU34_011113 [Plutella xylostella]|uniref:Uncharacterized protein n=1 Tax=Plutella xylostella TaxID=51655 RepID=A0ABQ7QG55_PLUXY|nr:hypothetical protein JYU34_011113 [Plutella xylostella]